MNYWLFKSEPDVYSIDDLANEPAGWGRWDGIRNYQARNLLRDQVKKGDGVLIYHSSCRVPGVVGVAGVVKSGYPDPAQFDPESDGYDGKSSQDNPRWFCVDVAFQRKFNRVLTMQELKQGPSLMDMVLFRQGRLSVQPVTAAEWHTIMSLAESL